MAFERLLYRAPRSQELRTNDRCAEPQCEVLYNGTRSVAGLWKTLLLRQTPHLQIVWHGPDGNVRLIAESRVAIPNRNFFCASLSLALDRHRLLCKRAERRLLEAASPDDFPVIASLHLAPRGLNLHVMRFAAWHLKEKMANQFHKRLSRRGHWGIALHHGGTPDRAAMTSDASAMDETTWWLQIPSPRDRFYADPFPWRDESGLYHLFFEDLSYASRKGVISHVALDPGTMTWASPPRVVLDRPYHLSYPFIFEYEGAVYMIPETSANRTIETYRAAPFPGEWVLHDVLMHDIVAADTTLHCEAGTWWMFTTIEQGEGPNWDELHLFHGATPFGPWKAHPANPIVSDVRRARMAGNIFRDANSRLIRPAQDCEREYGAALWFCEITALSPFEYAETAILVKDAPPERSGLHTWNKAGDITVVDLKMNIYMRAGARMGYQRA